jgi:hydroxymethylpyrimidine pyrophosphatase-like HAD family hydrolase
MELSNLSNLNKTWIFDLDGTLVVHNGYKNGKDELLPNVKLFFKHHVKKSDYVLILTGRSSRYKKMTEEFLFANKIYYDHIIYDLPLGERILFNDKKDSGLITAYSVNLDRDQGIRLKL